ncbi:MAG TPA: hypothetical protein VGL35_08880 [Rhizomicrobium sp.]|jgi:hypothetical protein
MRAAGNFQFSGKWHELVRNLPETGMDYTIVRIVLNDGRRFDQAMIDSGRLVRIRGLPCIPFSEEEVVEIAATHEKWKWNEKP